MTPQDLHAHALKMLGRKVFYFDRDEVVSAHASNRPPVPKLAFITATEQDRDSNPTGYSLIVFDYWTGPAVLHGTQPCPVHDDVNEIEVGWIDAPPDAVPTSVDYNLIRELVLAGIEAELAAREAPAATTAPAKRRGKAKA